MYFRVAWPSDVLIASELDRNAAHCGQDILHGTHTGTGIDDVEILAVEVDARVFHAPSHDGIPSSAWTAAHKPPAATP